MIIVSEKIVEKPDVSVVVITYNQQNYIKECLDSILSQKNKNFNFEIIIGEDHGDDNTKHICEEYQKKYPQIIKLLLQDSNQGLIKNFKDVLSLCRGKYVAVCAGDDYWCDDLKLQKQYDFLQRNADYGFVRTGYCFLYPDGKLVEAKEASTVEGWVSDYAFYGAVSMASSIFFQQDLLQYINFDEFIARGFTMEDYPMQAIFSKYTKFGYIPDVTTVYRQLEKSITNSLLTDYYKKLHYIEGSSIVFK